MPFTDPTNGAFDYPQQIGRLIDTVEGPLFRNFVRNGDFEIAQRGASFAGITTEQYTLDGWKAGHAGTSTVTQESFTVGQTDVPDNPRKFLRLVRSVAAGSDNVLLENRIEFPERLSGKTVTVSFRAKVASGTKALVYDFGSSGVTSAVNTSDNAASVTTTWTLFSAQVAIPAMTAATSGAYLSLRIREAASFGTFTLDIADVQVEEGSEATRFERLNLETQMRWCQRFLPAIASSGTNHPLGSGMNFSTTQSKVIVPFPVAARAAITAISIGAASHFSVLDSGATGVACSGVIFNRGGTTCCELSTTVAAGLTAGNATNCYFNNASGSIVFTGAEL